MSAPPRIGYYVHHHGRGHASRAVAIAAQLRRPVTFLTSLESELEGGEVVSLPLDTDRAGIDVVPPELHFAPLGSPGLRRRMATIATWIAATAPDLLVVDVSVEVAALARLCGVPVVYVRQSGRRTDPAHELAYGWAGGLLAPSPAWLEPADTAPRVLERTFHSGSITRFDGRPRPERDAPRPNRVLVCGEGVRSLAPRLASAASAWEVLDTTEVDLDLLASCAVVVAPAGANIVAEAAFAGCGLVCLPQPRPFDEQRHRGRDLARRGAAVVLGGTPEPRYWPWLLEGARRRRRRLSDWADGLGAERAARYLERVASAAPSAGSSTPRPSSQRTRPRPANSSSQPRAGQLPQVR
jgi:hypothetical protein